MALLRRLAIGQPVRGQDQRRLRMAGAVGTGGIDRLDKSGTGRARSQRAIHLEPVGGQGIADRVGEPLRQEIGEPFDIAPRDRQAGGHRVSTPLGEQARFNRGTHGSADIDTGDRTRRAGPDIAPGK